MNLFRSGRPGLAWGGLLAGSLALFLALASLVHVGARLLLGDSVPLPLSGAAVGRLCVAYLAGGLAAGILFGRLLPLARRKAGAVAAAFVSAVPFLVGIRVAVEGAGDWTVWDVVRVAGLSLAAGVFAGRSAWRARNSSGRPGYGSPPGTRSRMRP